MRRPPVARVAQRSLDTNVTYLTGVGPARADALRKLGIFTARELFLHIPHRYEDASTVAPIAGLRIGVVRNFSHGADLATPAIRDNLDAAAATLAASLGGKVPLRAKLALLLLVALLVAFHSAGLALARAAWAWCIRRGTTSSAWTSR